MLLDQISAMEPQNFRRPSGDEGLDMWLKGLGTTMDRATKDLKKIASEQERFTSSFSSLFKENIQLSKGRNSALVSIDSSINRQTLQVSRELKAVSQDVRGLGRNIDAGFIGLSADLRTLGTRQEILISQNKDMLRALDSLRDISFPEMDYDGFDGMVFDLEETLRDFGKSNTALAVISADNKKILGDIRSDFREFRSDFRNVMGYIANRLDSRQDRGLSDLSSINSLTIDAGSFADDFTDTFMERWEEFMEDFRNSPPPRPAPNPSPGGNPGGNSGGGAGDDSSGSKGAFRKWLEDTIAKHSGLDQNDLKNFLGDSLIVGGTIASLLTSFTSKYDENYSSMLDKISLTTGIARHGSGGAYDTRQDVLDYSRGRNDFKGRLGSLSERFTPEEYDEAMNKLLDTGISDLTMLAEATAESALSNKILPELNISSQQYFKDLLVEYEDGADRIRGVTMLVKDYSEDMWVSPTTLQDTVERNHRTISAITKDLESYMKVMDKTIKAKGRLEQAGLDLGLDEFRDQFTTNFIGNWDDGSLRKMDMMQRVTGMSRGELLQLSVEDPEAFNSKYMEAFWEENKKFLNPDGTFNYKSTANSDAFLNKMQNVYGMSSSDVREALDFLGGGYDRYKTTEGVDSTDGLFGFGNLLGNINKEAAEKVEGQMNTTWQQEVSGVLSWLKEKSGFAKALDWAGITGANVIAILGFLIKMNWSDLLSTGRALLTRFPQLGNLISSAGSKLGPIISNIGSKLGPLITSGLSKLGTIFSGGIGSLGTNLLSMGSNLLSGLGSLGSTIVGGVTSAAPAVAAAALPAAAITWGLIDFTRGVNKAKEWYGEDADGYDKTMAGVASVLGGTGGGVLDDRSYAEKGMSIAGGAAKGALAGAAIGSAIPVVGTAVGAVVGGIAGTVGSMIGGENIAKGFGWIKEKAVAGNAKLDEMLEEKWGKEGKALADVKNGVIEGFGDALGGVSEGVASAVGGVGSGLNKILHGDIIGGVGDAAFGLVKGVGSVIGGIGTGIAKVGKGLWKGFKDLMGWDDDEAAEEAENKLKEDAEKLYEEPVLPQTSQYLQGTTDNPGYYSEQPMLDSSAYYDETALNNDLLYMPSKNMANYDNTNDTSGIIYGRTNEDALMSGTLSLDNKFADSVLQGNYGDLSAGLYNPDEYHLGLDTSAQLGTNASQGVSLPKTSTSIIPFPKTPAELLKYASMQAARQLATGEKTLDEHTFLTAGMNSVRAAAQTVYGDENTGLTEGAQRKTTSDAGAIVNAIVTLEQNLMIRLDSLISSKNASSDNTKPAPDYYTPALAPIGTTNDQDIRNYAM